MVDLDMAPSDDRATAMIDGLKQISRRNNRQLDVTGCLLLAGPLFAQVLEGRRDAVEPLVARIAADPRHRQVRVLVERQTSARMRPDTVFGALR